MRTRNLLFAIITATMLIFCSVFICNAETIASGECGGNLTWVLDDEYTLTISGTGNMDDYISTPAQTVRAPWYGKFIKKIIVSEGVTSIGERAFMNCTNLRSVFIPNSVTKICSSGNDGSFRDCINLSKVSMSMLMINFNVICSAFWGTPYRSNMLKSLKRCQHCGGEFIGHFSKKCTQCGKPKDY